MQAFTVAVRTRLQFELSSKFPSLERPCGCARSWRRAVGGCARRAPTGSTRGSARRSCARLAWSRSTGILRTCAMSTSGCPTCGGLVLCLSARNASTPTRWATTALTTATTRDGAQLPAPPHPPNMLPAALHDGAMHAVAQGGGAGPSLLCDVAAVLLQAVPARPPAGEHANHHH